MQAVSHSTNINILCKHFFGYYIHFQSVKPLFINLFIFILFIYFHILLYDPGYTMQSPELIDLNQELLTFNEDEWIGKGRQYPKGGHVPLALTYYIDGLLTIPNIEKDKYTPSSNISIEDFIKMKLKNFFRGLGVI